MTRSIRTCIYLMCLLQLLVTGCSYKPERHDMVNLVPSDYDNLLTKRSVQLVSKPEQIWWRGFNMPELDALLREMEKANYDFEIARQRVTRSRALLGQQHSRNWPTLDASLTGTGTATDVGSDTLTGEGRLLFVAAYEVDLWGTRAAADQAAELDVIAEQARFRSVALSLQAETAQQYFDLLSLKDRIEATEKNLATGEELLKLIKLRFDTGRVSRIELDQQRSILFSQRARLLILKRARDLAEHALAVLLGRDPLQDVAAAARLMDATVPLVDMIQPADLLKTRPDIVVAKANLKKSDAVVYQNRAKRWPTLQFTAEAALNDIIEENTSWTTSLIGQLALPLFNAGHITKEIEAARIDASIALKTYKQKVIRALREVADTISDLNHQRAIFSVRRHEVDSTKLLYDLARQRFDAGSIDFINLLDVQRTLFSATDRIIMAKREYLAAAINTFKAMGVPPVLLEPPIPRAYSES